jgi:hypothetical protein
MIYYVICSGHEHTIRSLQKDPHAPSIGFLTYDQIIHSKKAKWATYIFTDFDRLSYFDLELAARVYRQLRDAGVKVLNDPSKVMMRYSLLRSLHRLGLNDFNVYQGNEVPEEMRFPVYIRKTRGHSNHCTDLLQTRSEVVRALDHLTASGIPADHLLITEYAGEPIRPNLYRKCSAFLLDSVVYPQPSVHENNWVVKTGPNCIAEEELYKEDSDMVRENPYADKLRKVFAIANIEYGRADFGFYRGRLQVFEINTNPHILAPKPHPSPVRMATAEFAWQQFLQALHAVDSKPGGDIRFAKDPVLKQFRKHLPVLYRSRPVP